VVMRQHTVIRFACCVVQILTRIRKLPDDDHLMIETCWSDFKCFSVTFELMFSYKQVHYLDHYI
jgi:hypothetical protein